VLAQTSRPGDRGEATKDKHGSCAGKAALLAAVVLAAAAVMIACGSAGSVVASAPAPSTAAAATAAATTSASPVTTSAAPRANRPALALRRLPGAFNQPVYLTSPPGDPHLLVVVEKVGTVRVIRNGSLLAQPFLNLTGRVSGNTEQGLLSLAFDPQYSTNGFFYVYYTDLHGYVRVARYHVSTNPDVADPASATVLLSISHPHTNHNGGQLQFGPDGLLYIGVGDGGQEGDPNNYGQNLHVLFAKILTLNVRLAHPRPVTFAYGLRNPWRFSFDMTTGALWIGDVGQDKWEEIDYLKRGTSPGTNFGWSYYEGHHVYKPQAIDRKRLIFPVFEYSHALGNAVVGGYVYRGSAIAGLRGWYLFADYGSGRVWAMNGPKGRVRQISLGQNLAPVSSFGQDAAGNLYLICLSGGVYEIVHR
jgi:glucose/arabinose dehydrogenase